MTRSATKLVEHFTFRLDKGAPAGSSASAGQDDAHQPCALRGRAAEQCRVAVCCLPAPPATVPQDSVSASLGGCDTGSLASPLSMRASPLRKYTKYYSC